MKDVRTEPNRIWRVRLFDGPVLEDESGHEVRRFRSLRIGALLAYLALHLGRFCPREEMYEALWPEEDLAVAANRFRVALASLRRQLEPAEVPFGTVLDVTVPGQVRMRAETVWCDAVAVERAWRAGRRDEAARLLQGDLLPGYYDEWALAARQQFAALGEELAGTTSQANGIDAGGYEAPAPSTSVRTKREAPGPRLPLYLTRFFGREVERRHLVDLVTENRLATITGPGGIGKTRLAVETAQEISRPSVFVPLADLPDAHRVPEALLQALLISPQANVDPLQQLISVLLRQDPLLLILDNAEHLLDSVASVGLRLLAEVPDLRLLITSRQRLDLPGEAILSLEPLKPPPTAGLGEGLMESPAVALFVDRARHARPDFVLTSGHADAVLEICRRLEGLPLALELAAARVTVQTPVKIAEALATGITELKSHQRGLSERHRSLRAAVQGSLDLLTPELHSFFAMLSVFQGGWTVEAARAVTGREDAEALLENLVVSSLVVAREAEDGVAMRCSFREALRPFAAEQLTGEAREVCAERHAAFYLALAADVDQDDMRTLAPLDADQENLLSALEWGRKTRSDVYWKGLIGFLNHSYVCGHQRIAIGLVNEALTAVPTVSDAELQFKIRYAASGVLVDLGRLEEATLLARQLTVDAEENGNPVEATFAETVRGFAEENAGHVEEAALILRNALLRARSLDSLDLLLTSLSLTGSALIGLANQQGVDTEAGKTVLTEAEILCREYLALIPPYSRRLALARLLLSMTLSAMGRKEEAYAMLKETQRTAIRLRTMTTLMYGFIHECDIAVGQGLFEQAGLLYGAFLERQERMGYSIHCINSLEPDWTQQLGAKLRDRLGEETFEALVQTGRQTPPEELAARELPALVNPRRVN